MGAPAKVDVIGIPGVDAPEHGGCTTFHGRAMSDFVVICGGWDWAERRTRLCPTENRRRRFYVTCAFWYGATWTCLGCGDRWQDGERGERPFMRGWRREAIAQARKGWAAVPSNWRELREAAFERLRRDIEGAP